MEATRRSRPHPARRARRITGAVGASGFVALAGWFALTTDVSNAATPANATTSIADSPSVTPSPLTPTGRGSRRRSSGSPAVPAAPSNRPSSSSHGS